MNIFYYGTRLYRLGLTGLCYRLYLRMVRYYFWWRYNHKMSVKKDAVLKDSILFPYQWHQDPASGYQWSADLFYQDIIVSVQNNALFDQQYPDIKGPWETSRLSILHSLNPQQWQTMVADWLEKNPCLYGVNWMNPMEVAIRATHLIISAERLFGKERNDLLQKTLTQHAWYLAYHWEWSDKPNNHYIADILGYFYLCSYLSATTDSLIKKYYYRYRLKRTFRWMLQQIKQQVHEEGTSYEGSTAYHRLVVEMMALFIKRAEQESFAMPAWLYERYQRMVQFLAACTDQGDNLVLIGDDDSGTLHALPIIVKQETVIKTYERFGLTVIKTDGWHITFRHPTYCSRQPTGHFHQDLLAITVSLDGVPIIVDPGSYTYTGNPAWRNRFRSWESHATFYKSSHQSQDLCTHDLFQLPRKTYKPSCVVQQEGSFITIHDVYDDHQDCFVRRLVFDTVHERLIIEDTVITKNTVPVTWNMMIHPAITLEKKDDILFSQGTRNLMNCSSSLDLMVTEGWYAPTYGTQQNASRLYASHEVVNYTKQITVLYRT